MNQVFRPPNGGQIFHMNALSSPEVHGEYHAESKKLYVVHLRATPVTAELLADKVSGKPEAHALFSMWIKGYVFGKAKTVV